MFGSPIHLAPHAVANQESLSIAIAMLVHTRMEVPGSIPRSSRVFWDFYNALREWADPAGDAPVRPLDNLPQRAAHRSSPAPLVQFGPEGGRRPPSFWPLPSIPVWPNKAHILPGEFP